MDTVNTPIENDKRKEKNKHTLIQTYWLMNRKNIEPTKQTKYFCIVFYIFNTLLLTNEQTNELVAKKKVVQILP